MAWLTDEERAAISLVLEPRPALTHKRNPGIQPLSLYSSELKGLKQLASELDKVQSGQFAKREGLSKARYFRSLRVNGVVAGTAENPVLTPESAIVFSVAAHVDDTLDYWQRNRDAVEGPLVLSMAEKLATGREDEVDEHAKRVFWNVQLLFDLVPDTELVNALNDLELLKILQFSNSVGIEAARYFRLESSERSLFRAAFQKVLSSGSSAPAAPKDEIEKRAKKYYQAAAGHQADIRFRVAGFLTAYRNAQISMGNRFPRLSRTLKVINMLDNSTDKVAISAGKVGEPIGPYQLIISGCPGSGKSFWLDEVVTKHAAEVVRTQFHAETSYYDFVGSYKPVPVYESVAAGTTIKTADGTDLTHGRPLISYQFVPGPLVEALVAAVLNPTRNVVLVIEELNRGNCAAIFGDVFQLLDRGPDGQSRYGITMSLDLQSYLADVDVLAKGEKLRLPANLYLWATMNSADQGVFPLDTAFRRRWDFIYRGHGEPCAYPASVRQIMYRGDLYDWDEFRSVLNAKLLAKGAHEDKLIGPYFLTVQQLASADAILNKLFLYLWDDVLRFRQDELFVESSFAEVGRTWDQGKGAPLSLELDPALVISPDEQDDGQEIMAGPQYEAGPEAQDGGDGDGDVSESAHE